MKYPEVEKGDWMVAEGGALAAVDPVSVVDQVAEGLPTGEFDTLRRMLEITVDEMASKVGISVATLSRRRAKKQPLGRDHSDRIVRYARLYWLSAALFADDEATARAWLKRPALSLGHRTPLDFAETEVGAREVEDLIGRLEHGVYV